MHGEARLRGISPGKPPLSTERRLLFEYHERVLAESTSPDRRMRSERWLARRREQVPIDEVATLRADADERLRLTRIMAAPAAPAIAPIAETFDGMLERWQRMPKADQDRVDEDLEVIWDGTMGHDGKSITGGEGMGSSLGQGEATLHRSRR